MAESGELAFQSGDRTQQVPDLRKVPPSVTDLVVVEAGESEIDGSVLGGIRVFFVPPVWWGEVHFDIWAKHGDLTGFVWVGRTRATGGRILHPFLLAGNTYTIAVCSVSVSGASIEPDGAPQATLTLTGQPDPVPADVTGFSVQSDGPFLRFAWDALPNPDLNVSHFRIQAGAAWVGGALVALVAPAGARQIAVPRAQAPGAVFAIKAVTRTGIESSAPAVAYLTSTEQTCIDAERQVVPREVTIPGGASSVVVTTICPYDTAPFITAMGTNGLTAWADPLTFAQDGTTKLWSFTLHVDDIAAPGGEGVYIHEAGTPEPDIPEDAPPALAWAPKYPDLLVPIPSRVPQMQSMVALGPVLPIPPAPFDPALPSWHPEYPDLLPGRRRMGYLGPWREDRRTST
jgi:hypothetical protein